MKIIATFFAVILLLPAFFLSGFASIVSGILAVCSGNNDSLKNLWISVDQVFNAAFCGSPDETISARAWRLQDHQQNWAMARLLIDALFLPWEKNHCQKSFESELQRKQLPENYRS